MTHRPYVRHKDLPNLIRVPKDWLMSNDPEITKLIIARLLTALDGADQPRLRSRSLRWVLAAEKTQL